MAHSQARVPAGTPGGGRFAQTYHSESEISLDAADLGYDDLLDLPDDLATEAPRDHWDEGAAEVLDQLRRSGRFWVGRFGGDADDLVSQTAAAYYASLSRRTDMPANVAAYLHAVARTESLRSIPGYGRSENRNALRVLAERSGKLEAEWGRALTVAEHDALAEQVRMEQPKGRRAAAGYHLRRKLEARPASDVLDNRAEDMEEIAGATGVAGTSFDPTEASESDRELDEWRHSIVSGELARHEARREVWAKVIPSGPPPAAETLDEIMVAALRKKVAAGGGAAGVASAWYEGDADAESAEALFRPFGRIGNSERAQVVRALLLRRAYADDLWDSACAAATKRRGRGTSARRRESQGATL